MAFQLAPITELEWQLNGFRLTTAEILYHFPDYPRLLQSYVWQDLDLAPQFPKLNKFLIYWDKNLEGKLHSVTIATVGLIKPATYRCVEGELRLQ